MSPPAGVSPCAGPCRRILKCASEQGKRWFRVPQRTGSQWTLPGILEAIWRPDCCPPAAFSTTASERSAPLRPRVRFPYAQRMPTPQTASPARGCSSRQPSSMPTRRQAAAEHDRPRCPSDRSEARHVSRHRAQSGGSDRGLQLAEASAKGGSPSGRRGWTR